MISAKRIKIFFLFFLFVAPVVYHLWILGNILWLIKFNPKTSAFMENSLDEIQEKNPDASLKHKWVDYANISVNVKRAVIAAEDAKFLNHDGFDWDAIHSAFERNIRKGRIVAGGSTISQQLAKNLFLSKSRNPFRKIEEAFITFMIEMVMSKKRILEIYLNIIEWGEGIFGIEAASQYYFKRSATAVSPLQAANLAAIIPNPAFFQKKMNSNRIRKKASVLLYRMRFAKPPE